MGGKAKVSHVTDSGCRKNKRKISHVTSHAFFKKDMKTNAVLELYDSMVYSSLLATLSKQLARIHLS